MTEFAVSVDIGSTWTKGALVDLGSALPLARAEAPTTTDDLSRGFEKVYAPLAEAAVRHGRRNIETFLSSSAKGGLRIAAIGIVPDLTLKAAKLAAASAGGKVVAGYSYRLKSRDIEQLAATTPDLILLAGGTDGGDESYILGNAEALASSSIEAAFVYAGNAAVRDEVLYLLSAAGKRVIGTDNLLPDLDRLEYDGARKAIAELFLERIIEGRGLSAVRSRCSAEPRATPAAVFDLVRVLDEGGYPGTGGGLLVVDMGGATTDVYSASDAFAGGTNSVYRGIPEPRVKRSVEGDLGLRVSARQVLELGLNEAEAALGSGGGTELEAWVAAVSADTGRLPRTVREHELDAFLSKVCVAESVRRHAGTVQGVYTASGLVWVQTGKDLSRVNVAIGTGGALAREGSGSLFRSSLAMKDEKQPKAIAQAQRSLMPDGEAVRYFRDAEYLIPLAANLATKHAEVARELALSGLVEEDGRSGRHGA
jgi:uncharacterized protein (TIGR01319 family)